MDEYIERKALRDALYDADAITIHGVKLLNQFPAADVEPVRHAHWIECDDYYDGGLHLSEYKCNICGATEAMFYGKYPTYKYCHCGAKMDERKDK